MNIEPQVTSKEISQRLKDLGVKQESYFRWCLWNSPNGAVLWDSQTPELATDLDVKTALGIWDKGIAAFTVAELGEMLWTAFEKTDWNLIYKAYGDNFGFKDTQYIGELGIVNLMRRPDMAGKMLAYLLENKLITV